MARRYLTYCKVFLVLVMLSVPLAVSAQQDSQYTQYMYNTHTVNPAYAGNRGMLSLYGLYRAQWVGLEGAPTTMNFSVNSPVGKQGVGLGLSFVRDEIGPSIENNLAVDFSYTIQTSRNTKLSFGLKGGVNNLEVDYTKLNQEAPESVFENNVSRFSPMIGVGAYFHGSDRWYVGLSSPNLLKTEHYGEDVQRSEVTEEIHAYLIGGYVFDLGDSAKFKPAVLVKSVTGAPLALDLSANFLFNEKFTLGAAYRLDAAVSALAGFQVSDQLMIGYAYDYDTTDLGNYNSGSHEIFLRFELKTSVRRTVNPRFF
ncbi:type IX secretion system membrane protein PorP/SprF [Galbibacter sp. EGI 63066]|uniref:PorP/SprF family type IX secretion system membrane protein n=1 Tax=Galbibacter sp. EGI 63066 TaxID=2993559 RepID=UPI002249A183|nr:type IX secretion system membrane protein PorP/SprF [Galbibacter sp. EGI 63066]MCX2678366.1 type IX secretion system membrane protein PorP/SprF [Galbibacter sp. EGI 63066]